MKLARKPSPAARGGFTLIELMVVIAIIAILVALTASAVMHTLIQGPKVTARVEIGQFEGSVQSFQTKYGVSYVPSRIILRKYQGDYYTANGAFLSQLDQDSVTYLTTVFHSGGQRFTQKWINNGINWHSNWAALAATAHPFEVLEGEQCLVFFLGGIPATNPNGCLGFSTDDANPDNLGGTRNSFYDFKSSRLVTPNANATFFAYQDPYGKGGIYAYFSAYGVTNNYNKYYTAAAPLSDCTSLGVWPYAESPTPVLRYLKPSTCQILCAGADGAFGPGTNPTSASPFYWNSATAGLLSGTAGADDQANFAPSVLLAGP